MKALCIYHRGCTDGFGAAWAVWKALGDTVEFIRAFMERCRHYGRAVRFPAARVRPNSERQRPKFERANGRTDGKTSLKTNNYTMAYPLR